MDQASERVTTNVYHHFFSLTDQARITGRTGSTQGARIVSIPAINDAKISEIIINLLDAERRVQSSFE